MLVVVTTAALSFGAWKWRQYYAANHVVVRFDAPADQSPELDLTFFPDRLAFSSPSPPPPLGRMTSKESTVTLGADLVPECSVVRYQGEGFGAGFANLRLGKSPKVITLRGAATLTARVAEPVYFWCMGWRCAGFRPVVGAEVFVMGGGEHGVDLARAETDEQGVVTVSGYDGQLDALGLRVRASGFEIAHQRLPSVSESTSEDVVVTMTRTQPRRGRVVVDADVGLQPQDLLVLARGLPGVQARPHPSGRLVIDHVGADIEARLICHGLPDTVAYDEARTVRGGEFELRVSRGATVAGRVLGPDLRAMPNAVVWIEQRRAVRTDQDGSFKLTNLLPGRRTVEAQWRPKRRKGEPLFASRPVTLTPGLRLERVELLLEK